MSSWRKAPTNFTSCFVCVLKFEKVFLYLNSLSKKVDLYTNNYHHADDNKKEISSQVQGYNLVRWTNSGMSCWAVSDLNNVELNDFVKLLQQP